MRDLDCELPGHGAAAPDEEVFVGLWMCWGWGCGGQEGDFEPVPEGHGGGEAGDAQAGGGGEGCGGGEGEDGVCGDCDELLEAAGAAVAVVCAYFVRILD